MRIAVCGGRDEHLNPKRAQALRDAFVMFGATEIVTGGCRGIDEEAETLARELGLLTTTFRPAWDKHGKAAGPLRNEEIANYADKLIAFPGGNGTVDMIRRMEEKGKTVVGIAL